jgi:hypothetical protein
MTLEATAPSEARTAASQAGTSFAMGVARVLLLLMGLVTIGGATYFTFFASPDQGGVSAPVDWLLGAWALAMGTQLREKESGFRYTPTSCFETFPFPWPLNTPDDDLTPEQQARRFTLAGQEWTELRYVGNRPGTTQPIFHIDMFITLAGRGSDGRYRVLVGDPRAAAQLLGSDLPVHAMAPVFDDVAAGLGRQGFDVHRNPLPLVYVDDPDRRERLWYFASSNNALVDGEVVYLPSYGHGTWAALATTDQANEQLWHRLGFQVRFLADFHPFAENLGAAHCITKYLARAM